MNRQDERSQKTEQTVQSTLIRLLCEMSLQKIKVIDLCTTADINRTTFYLHYNSVQDVLDQFRNEISNKVFTDRQCIYEFEKQKNPLPFFLLLADILKSFPNFVKFIRYSSESAGFLILLKNDIFEKLCSLYVQKLNKPLDKIKYLLQFITVGFMDLCVEWLKDNEQVVSFDKIINQCQPIINSIQKTLTQSIE